MIKRTFIYFAALTLLLYGLRFLHYRGLLKQEKGYYAKYKTAFFEKNEFDVIFLGSSRVEMHYNTRIFDSLTGSNSFNLSLAGATPQVAHAVLKAYLHNSRAPRYLIYDVDYHFLKYKSDEIKEFNNYFPFLLNPVLREQFSRIDKRMPHFYYNPYFSFPYTGLKNLSTSLHGWLNIENKTDSLYHKGYLKEVFRPHLGYVNARPYYSFIHPNERNYLDSIIQTCRQEGISLCFVSSPVFGGGRVDLLNKDQVISQIGNIAAINNIGYYDISSLPFCNNRKLFIDHFHMNHSGANRYSLFFGNFFNNKIAGKPLK